ncbi:MAG: hypothetical protein IT379_13050 [Deltaproteobacteria bacterium]|nr:hypothetical protein [Deltaproteobacteria bacterium]
MIGRAVLGVILGAMASAGCTVDSAFLDRTTYFCNADEDCGAGWSCINADPVAPRVCARRYGTYETCVASCDGRCTARGECLRGCLVGVEGECPSGTLCLSVNFLVPQEGVCYPVDRACSSTAPCEGGDVCLGDIGGTESAFTLYCVPPPISVGRCQEGYVFVSTGAGESICLPSCDAVDSSCPLGLGCLTQAYGVVGAGTTLFSSCFPGVAGAPCDDDTNCLLGRCANGICALPCADADAVTGLTGGAGCMQFDNSFEGELFELRCNPESGNCEPRYELGNRCANDGQCAEGLFCETIPEPLPGAGRAFCTADCLTDDNCAIYATPGTNAICIGPAAFRRCAPSFR